MEQIFQSNDITELSKALCKAQTEMQPAKKDSENPFFKSAYADMTEVVEVSRPVLVQNGLSITQTSCVLDGQNLLITQLNHISGQWVRGYYAMKAEKSGPQAEGSAMTYARRYTYKAIIGLTDVDDDGEKAMVRKPENKPVQKTALKDNPVCPLHNIVMFPKEANGKKWFSHKNIDGSWCNGKVKPQTPIDMDSINEILG